MKNDVLDVEKPMLMLADWLEAERYHAGLIAAQADALILDGAVNVRRARAALFDLGPAALRAQAEAWAVVQAIADADPPIGRQEARMFAEKAIRLAQAGGG